MQLEEHQYLFAERKNLLSLLEEIPAEDLIGRSSIQSRISRVEEELSQTNPVFPVRSQLTFQGRPVVGQHGIFAEFGAKAISAFTDVVSKVAAGLSRPLASTGPIPNREESRLLITGTVLGSFGFELEEAPVGNQLVFFEDTIAAQALELTQNLLRNSLGTDEELADSAENTDPRAITALRSFLELLATNEAICGLQFKNRSFQFQNIEEVQRGFERLSQDNLQEKEIQLIGEFQGILPKARTFEFKVADSQEIIRGKISPAIPSPEEINKHLQQRMAVNFLGTRIGSARLRYVLTKLPEWNELLIPVP